MECGEPRTPTVSGHALLVWNALRLFGVQRASIESVVVVVVVHPYRSDELL